jgi:hypothetical protein
MSVLLLVGLASSPLGHPDWHDLPPPRGDQLVETEIRLGDEGAYIAPVAGWTYRPLARGQRLRPPFYAPRYVIGHPAGHGLAAARGTSRWIRYGDDAVLVDVMNGRVVKVVRKGYRKSPR